MSITDQWKAMIDGALTDVQWDAYDQTIQTEVSQYTARLAIWADWKLFKAQVWTESGAAVPAWKTRPMQIGNPGDPAYATLKNHRENSDIIMSDAMKADLKRDRSINDPVFNIQLGLAYAYTKVATFGSTVTDRTIREYTVRPGDAIDRIAVAVGSTRQDLLDLNPTAKGAIFPNQKLKYQKASIKVISCPAFTPELLQSKYNGNGDPSYADKIKYCQSVIAQIKR
jgi:LysM repeat protein